MPVSINTLNVGDVVYDAKKVRQGNTTIRRLSVWSVRIVEINLERKFVMASWNGNPPQKFYAQSGKLPWRRSKPETTPLFRG